MERTTRNPGEGRRRLWSRPVVLLAAIGSLALTAQNDRYRERSLPASATELRLGQPLAVTELDASSLFSGRTAANRSQKLIVRLKTPAVGDTDARGARAIEHKVRLQDEQSQFLARCLRSAPGARVIARTQLVLNAVFLEVDASHLEEIARDPAVLQVHPVADYDLLLSETVPFIGAAAVQNLGFDGSGVRVAVLDSGIDYTHAAFGGSGDPADFAANDPNVVEPGSFPTAKVVDGFDFVGPDWEGGPESPPEDPDADPLDAGPGRGHGTHVADIIGGTQGVAPGVDLVAVKVCSSISTSCSGLALIQGMEFAVDPNGDGDPSDRVDIINMSLGSNYGQPFDDDLSRAVDNATKLGVLTVAAAGNGGDKPYIIATPSAADTALSTAQTHVPSAGLNLMTVVEPPEGDRIAIHQPWSAPLTTTLEGPVQYGDGMGGALNGCSTDPDDPLNTNPFPTGSLDGKIVLVDRGACFFSEKIFNIADAGGVLGIIGLVEPGEPFAGGFGGNTPFPDIPGFMIDLETANILRTGSAVVRFDPDNVIPLVSSMVGSSSRGPQNQGQNIKPEIGAPGASVSAVAGSGTGTAAFGGTSGASPMVAGSAALLMQARGRSSSDDHEDDDDHDRRWRRFGPRHHDRGGRPGRERRGLGPMEIKALLVNNGDLDIQNDLPGDLAPVTRIGGGEVRVDRALAAPAAAWADEPSGTLGFGFEDVWTTKTVLKNRVRIRNYSDEDRIYRIKPRFRFADDVSNGAVTIHAPPLVRVEEGKDAVFTVLMLVDGKKLRNNGMNSGSEGANPAPLTTMEYDGHLVLDDGEHPIHVPWHVLPRKAARVVPTQRTIAFGSSSSIEAPLINVGVGTAQLDAYSLLALSEDLPEGDRGEQSPTPDIRAVGVNTFSVPPSFCTSEFLWVFAVQSWERQSHLLPVSHQFWLDTNQDGVDDWVVLNRDVSFTGTTDGRQLSWAFELATGNAGAFFFAEHSTNTGNTALFVCGEQVGLSASDILATNVNLRVVAQDFYFGGPGDTVEGLTVTPFGERFVGSPSDLGPGDWGLLPITDFGAFPGNSDELGVLLFTNGDRGAGNRGAATRDSESILLTLPGIHVPHPETAPPWWWFTKATSTTDFQ